MFRVRVRARNKANRGLSDRMDLATKPLSVMDAYQLAELLAQIPEDRQVKFAVTDCLKLSPWERPEMHSIEKSHRYGAEMLFATRENGGTKICSVADLLPPERRTPMAWDYTKFICSYLMPYGVQRVVVLGVD